MKKAAAKTTSSTSGKPQFTVGMVGIQLLDTTWRIVVPVVLFTIIGIALDLRLGTKPWLTLPLVVFGFFVAGWLVKKQIEAVQREDES